MFDDAVDIIFGFEGGYSNNPNDPGGETNFGITQKVYDPSGIKRVKDITKDEAKHIYEENYWYPGKCQTINTVSSALAAIHFDNCVNCGTGSAAIMLQGVLGVKQDGIIGTETLSKINDSEELKIAYLSRRKRYYDNIIKSRPSSKEFLNSWYHRLNKLAKIYSINFTCVS